MCCKNGWAPADASHACDAVHAAEAANAPAVGRHAAWLPARLPLQRNPLLEPRVWILDSIFGNFGGPFWPILAHSGASGLQKSIPDDLTDLGIQNESSGACLRPDFGHFREKCEQFLKFSNFDVKKSAIQSLNFLSRSFLSGS